MKKLNWLWILALFSVYGFFAGANNGNKAQKRQEVATEIQRIINEQKSISEKLDDAFRENKNPPLMETMLSAIRLLIENINLFPFSKERSSKSNAMKVRVLTRTIAYNGGYTFPAKVLNDIQAGDISAVEKHADKYLRSKSQSIASFATLFAVAYMYAVGLGTQRNINLSLKWAKKLKFKGNMTGDKRIGIYRSLGFLINLIDPAVYVYDSAFKLASEGKKSKGLEKIRNSAHKNHYPPMQVAMARDLFLNVLNMREDKTQNMIERQAFELMLEVAKLPTNTLHSVSIYDRRLLSAILGAQTEVADMLINGIGTPVDHALGLKWAQKAEQTAERMGDNSLPSKYDRVQAIISSISSRHRCFHAFF